MSSGDVCEPVNKPANRLFAAEKETKKSAAAATSIIRAWPETESTTATSAAAAAAAASVGFPTPDFSASAGTSLESLAALRPHGDDDRLPLDDVLRARDFPLESLLFEQLPHEHRRHRSPHAAGSLESLLAPPQPQEPQQSQSQQPPPQQPQRGDSSSTGVVEFGGSGLERSPSSPYRAYKPSLVAAASPSACLPASVVTPGELALQFAVGVLA